ncbi:unnamed protein product [Ceratitis capitata]|uniref:(Mediterranean fruit fly) hypothetical protein n=1 Tax=Ceratitis capitata TaxID=7213 RepID=A0A811UH93_CERCA|nr:unnamed protein product [Ceratitis capitata]
MQNNPFRKSPGFFNEQKDHSFANNKRKIHPRSDFTKKEKEWGLKKFIPVVRPQTATPWATFKNEIIQKQQEEIHSSKNPNIGSEEARIFLKKREEKFRRMKIEEAKKEVTKWEDFSEVSPSKSTGQKRRKQISKNKKNKKSQSKNQSNFISKDILKRFDSKKLNFHQNNVIRQTITQTTHLARGAPLESVVNDLKRRGIRRKTSV